MLTWLITDFPWHGLCRAKQGQLLFVSNSLLYRFVKAGFPVDWDTVECVTMAGVLIKQALVFTFTCHEA